MKIISIVNVTNDKELSSRDNSLEPGTLVMVEGHVFRARVPQNTPDEEGNLAYSVNSGHGVVGFTSCDEGSGTSEDGD